MPESKITHHTFTLERSFPVAPDRVFAAFSDPVQKRAWFAGHGSHAAEEYELNFTVGGAERILSRLGPNTPFPGAPLRSEAIHLDIVPNKRIVMAGSMTLADHRFSAALATFELIPTETGTDLLFTHQAAFFENADGPEMRMNGWKLLLDRLAEHLS